MNDLLISKLALKNKIIQQRIVGPGLNQTNIAIRNSAKKLIYRMNLEKARR